MKRLLLIATVALTPAAPVQADVLLTYEGMLSSLLQVSDCSVDLVCDRTEQLVLIPVSGTLRFSFGTNSPFASLDPQISTFQFQHPISGRTIDNTSFSQMLSWNETWSTDYDLTNPLQESVLLQNPVSRDEWNATVGITATNIDTLEFAGAFKRLSAYEDTGEVRHVSSTWSVGSSQNRMYFGNPSPDWRSVQYTSSVLLQGPMPWSIATITEGYTDDDFLQFLRSSMSCGYCLQLSAISSIHDSLYSQLYSSNAYEGYARLTGLEVVSSVPEPSPLALLSLGLAGLAAVRRHKQ